MEFQHEIHEKKFFFQKVPGSILLTQKVLKCFQFFQKKIFGARSMFFIKVFTDMEEYF